MRENGNETDVKIKKEKRPRDAEDEEDDDDEVEVTEERSTKRARLSTDSVSKLMAEGCPLPHDVRVVSHNLICHGSLHGRRAHILPF